MEEYPEWKSSFDIKAPQSLHRCFSLFSSSHSCLLSIYLPSYSDNTHARKFPFLPSRLPSRSFPSHALHVSFFSGKYLFNITPRARKHKGVGKAKVVQHGAASLKGERSLDPGLLTLPSATYTLIRVRVRSDWLKAIARSFHLWRIKSPTAQEESVLSPARRKSSQAIPHHKKDCV